MMATLALVTLLLLQPGGAAAPPPAMPCQVFARGNAQAPQLVREWLARSSDERVTVCAQPGPAGANAVPLYAGEGAVSRHDGVCSYASHGLAIEGSGAAQRLRRYESSEATAMALADRDCPTPHPPAAPQPYTTTYDVSHAAFLSIIQLWSAVATSSAAFEHELACCNVGAAPAEAVRRSLDATEARQRLRAAILAGDMKGAVVTRIVRIPDSAFRRRYALFVTDPAQDAAGSRFYVLYLRRDWRGPSHIIGIAETD
ncbi:MAG TPA: hypothetical protein VLX08_00010 [Steroidobacteraceae bacterium]|nr:hypothetical protein [Steroidobacteraceae bacterium]